MLVIIVIHRKTSALICAGSEDEDVPPDMTIDFFNSANKSWESVVTTVPRPKLLIIKDANHYDVMTIGNH
jgi:hypothetical protein